MCSTRFLGHRKLKKHGENSVKITGFFFQIFNAPRICTKFGIWGRFHGIRVCQIYWLQKILFVKNGMIGFSTLSHVLNISGTCLNYVLCSCEPGWSNGNNYIFNWLTKKILTQEKDIFLVLSKRNVDEARIYSGGRGRFF